MMNGNNDNKDDAVNAKNYTNMDSFIQAVEPFVIANFINV